MHDGTNVLHIYIYGGNKNYNDHMHKYTAY